MAAQSKLQLVIEGVDKASGPLSKVNKSVNEMGNASKSSGSNLKALGVTALKVTATLAAVGLVVKKSFDLGKQGAAIKQTAQSFDFLLTKVGASANLLDQLRTASRGTISDMDLMSSTATLLAGAQGDLATELAKSTPRLLEIAKAAQKLNPALGDTTFLYDSLATGVKRASPMILDNLGLTIRIGAANEAYAEELGKTVEQLTANEQKQALLNETLRAGAVLVEQAGGTTESATDAYDQLETSVANLTDIYKVLWHDTFEPSVGTIVRLSKSANEMAEAHRAVADAVAAGNITHERSVEILRELSHRVQSAAEAIEYLEFATWRTAAATREFETSFQDLGFSMDITAKKQEDVAFSTNAGTDAFAFMAGVVGDFNEQELEELNIRLGSVSARLKDQLAVAMGETSQEIVGMKGELRVLTAELDKSWSAAKQAEWVALSIEIDQATTSYEELARAAAEAIAAMEAQDAAWAENVRSLNKLDREFKDTTGTVKRYIDGIEILEREEWELHHQHNDSIQGMVQMRDTQERLTSTTEIHTRSVGRNTSALRDNSAEMGRSDKLLDAYAIATGRASAESVALQDRIDAATEAFREEGEASGFTAAGITLLRMQHDAMTDGLRGVRSELNQTTGAIMTQGNAALGTTMSLIQMRAALVGAGGSYWGTASEQQVRSEFQSLADIQAGIDAQKAADIERFPFGSFEGHAYTVDKGVAGMSAEDWEAEYGYRLMQDYPRMDLPGMGGGLGADVKAQLEQRMKDRELPFVSGEAFTPGVKGTANVSSGQSVQMSVGQYEAEYGWRRDHPGMEMPDLAAHGADFMVPPHYPNDTYMMGVSSGERVSVTPSHMLGGGNGGGLTVNTINVYGVQTASSLYEEIVKAARQRGRAFAKIM